MIAGRTLPAVHVPSVDTALVDVDAILAGAWRTDSRLHGEEHWRCVAATGLRLVALAGEGDAHVAVAFGLVHDTRRVNDHRDPGHGLRAAAYARELQATGLLALDDDRLELLCHACALHADGLVSDDPTVGACWDADRLHLPRVGIDPVHALLSTTVARVPDRLEEAAVLRDSPPPWAVLLALIAEDG